MKTPPPKIRLFCTLDENGYGYATRGLIQALAAIKIGPTHLRVIPAVACSRARPMMDDEPWLHPYVTGPRADDEAINLVFLNPALVGTYHTSAGGRYNIAVTEWETNQLPKKTYDLRGEQRDAVTDLNHYNEIWTPTHFAKRVLETSGVTVPVFVIPHALTEELLAWPPKGPAALAKDQIFEMYHIGTWNARKAPDLLLRSYWAAGWNVFDPVRLRLHLTTPDRSADVVEFHANMIQQAVHNLRAANSLRDSPQLALCTLPVTYADICNMHYHGHAFVTLSKGEGFCLPAVEAAALGNYVIGGGGPALEDLAKVYQSGATLLPRHEVAVTPMPEVAGYELDQTWWETEMRAMTEEMKAVVAFAHETGMPLAEDVEAVRETYCPSAVGKLIKARLEAAGW